MEDLEKENSSRAEKKSRALRCVLLREGKGKQVAPSYRVIAQRSIINKPRDLGNRKIRSADY